MRRYVARRTQALSIGRCTVREQRYLTMGRAARRLGMDVVTLSRWARIGLVVAHRHESGALMFPERLLPLPVQQVTATGEGA